LQAAFVDYSPLYQKILLNRSLEEHKALRYTQGEFPSLALRGDYSRKEDTQFTRFRGDGELSLVLSVPLFSGGTLFSNLKAERMAKRIAAVEEFTELRRTMHAIENDRDRILSLRKVFAIQKEHLEQQREIVELSLKSYTIKQTSMQDLLTSKNRLIDAKNAIMATTVKLGTLYRSFSWRLGRPLPRFVALSRAAGQTTSEDGGTAE